MNDALTLEQIRESFDIMRKADNIVSVREKKPKHLFREMSAKEVEEFWTWLHDEAKKRVATQQVLMTDDKQGVRWLCHDEYAASAVTESALLAVRHKFVEMLAKEK